MSIVKVKPLEWEWDPRDLGDYWAAKSPVGEYEAGISDDGYAFACCDGPSMWEWQPDEDARLLKLSDAKAAAQSDFEARILSVIEVTPTDTHASDAAITGLKSMGEPE